MGGSVTIVPNWLLLLAAYAHTSIAVASMVYNTQLSCWRGRARWL